MLLDMLPCKWYVPLLSASPQHDSSRCSLPMLCSMNALIEQAGQPFLTECSIPAPLMLGTHKSVLLDCRANYEGGRLELRSILGNAAAVRLHFVACACSTVNKSLGSAISNLPCCLLRAAVQSATSLWSSIASQPMRSQDSLTTATRGVACSVRCTAQISLGRSETAGWWAHPAVADNVLHLGPATADVGSLPGDAGVTRVVAGIAAYAIWHKASLKCLTRPALWMCFGLLA